MASNTENTAPRFVLTAVGEGGWVRDWEGKSHLVEYEGVVCRAGQRVVGSLDWEDALDGISIENLWVREDYRGSPAVLLRLIRYLDDRYPNSEIWVGEYANPKIERLIAAFNRRPRRRTATS